MEVSKSQTDIGFENILGSKRLLVQIIKGPQKNLGLKTFGSKEIEGPNNFWVQKVLCKNVGFTKNFGFEKKI